MQFMVGLGCHCRSQAMSETPLYQNVGSPLIEQDAEYLVALLNREKIPHLLVQDFDQPLAAVGRTWFVQVQAKHLDWAAQIRADEFPEPAGELDEDPDHHEVAPRKRPILRSLFFGFAGAMVGLRVGVKLRGGGAGALLLGGVMGVVAMLASILFGAHQKPVSEDSKVAETDAEEPQKRGE